MLCLLRPRPSTCDDWQSCCYAWLGVTLAYIINNCKKVQRFCEKQINLFQNNLYGAPQGMFRRHCGSSRLTHVYPVPASMALSAAELQWLHGTELARATYSDAKSPYLICKILKEGGINITHQVARAWWTSYRQAEQHQ